MIKATVKNGRIEPLDPLPEDWCDGRKLVIQSDDVAGPANWHSEVAEAMSDVPVEDHDVIFAAVTEHRTEAKEQMRREMEDA